jgi:hypothetical protein
MGSTGVLEGQDELDAAGESSLRLLGQRAGDGRLVGGRQRGQVGGLGQVLQHQVPAGRAVEGQFAGEHLLVGDRQVVLIAVPAHDAFEGFGGGVQRGHAAGDGGEHALEVLDQAEVANLDVVEQQEDVVRLDVEVLQVELLVHQVERLGGLPHVTEQLVARDAGEALGAALREAVEEGAVGQLADDDQPAVDDLEAVQRQDVRVADRFDAVEGLQLLFQARRVEGGAALDDLDGLEHAAGGRGLPDLAEPARADARDEPISGDRFYLAVERELHCVSLPWTGEGSGGLPCSVMRASRIRPCPPE